MRRSPACLPERCSLTAGGTYDALTTADGMHQYPVNDTNDADAMANELARLESHVPQKRRRLRANSQRARSIPHRPSLPLPPRPTHTQHTTHTHTYTSAALTFVTGSAPATALSTISDRQIHHNSLARQCADGHLSRRSEHTTLLLDVFQVQCCAHEQAPFPPALPPAPKIPSLPSRHQQRTSGSGS